MFYAPVNTKAQVSLNAFRRTASAPSVIRSMVAVDWLYVSQVRDKWLERWQKEVMSR